MRQPVAPLLAGDAGLVIDDADGLRALRRSRDLYSSRPVAIRLPGLTPAQAAEIGERLQRDRTECGCALGAKSFFAGLAVTVVLTLTRPERPPALPWRVLLALVFAVACAGAGKAAGIASARRRLRREIDRLLVMIQTH
jgi:hypothetical protein